MAAEGDPNVNDLSIGRETSPNNIPGTPPFVPDDPELFSKAGKDFSINLTAALSELSGLVQKDNSRYFERKRRRLREFRHDWKPDGAAEGRYTCRYCRHTSQNLRPIAKCTLRHVVTAAEAARKAAGSCIPYEVQLNRRIVVVGEQEVVSSQEYKWPKTNNFTTY